MHERIVNLLREVAALLKQSGTLKMRGHELSKTADELRLKADGNGKDVIEQSKAEDK